MSNDVDVLLYISKNFIFSAKSFVYTFKHLPAIILKQFWSKNASAFVMLTKHLRLVDFVKNQYFQFHIKA